ncbi:MAG: lytic transglycosylase domain-containing protein [Sphingomicrobium sp.]
MAAALAGLIATSMASAHVIEVSSDGAIAIRDGGGASVWQAVDASGQKLVTPSASAWPSADVAPIAVTTGAPAGVPERFAALNDMAAATANISPTLLAALVWQESRWNPQAISSKGAIGLAQLMPATARDLGVDPRDPAANLIGGARYLRQMLDGFDGNVEKALAAYNAGAGRVRKANGIPSIPETQAYVRSIVQRVASISTGDFR